MDNLKLSSNKENEGEWYTKKGNNDDIVFSTKVSISRNLADFPFPKKFRNDDSVRVQTLIFDAFMKTKDADFYQILPVASFDHLSSRILMERGLISPETLSSPGAAIVMRLKGDNADSGIISTINDTDHLKISTFISGLNANKAFESCRKIDSALQENLQFASSVDFGFLTSNIFECGSGMKLSAKIFMPSTFFIGSLPKTLQEIQNPYFAVERVFNSKLNKEKQISIFDSYFEFSTKFAGAGSELEQIASFSSLVQNLIETEKKNSLVIKNDFFTLARDMVFKEYAKAKFAILLTYEEALRTILYIKMGINLKIFGGLTSEDFLSLIYRLQDAHIKTILNSQNFDFPSDIEKKEDLKIARLRAILLMDSIEKIGVINE